ncbi:hypothetical protein HY621_01785 [Candidatus Uhrbacteria bacterium]|nr:hypothetical protein [Candidatus Uhrbacteria bacterium]
MILYEHEGKNLFRSYGIKTPQSVLVSAREELAHIVWDIFPCVLKVQVLKGKRGLHSGIFFAENTEDLSQKGEMLFAQPFQGEQVCAILVEEKISILAEWYLSMTYSTRYFSPVLLFSFSGGNHVEEQRDIFETVIHPVRGFEEFRIRNFFLKCGVRGKDLLALVSLSRSLYTLFSEEDARLAEINPLVRLSEGEFRALDAKVILDDDSEYRHTWHYPSRTVMGRAPTPREQAVRVIDTGEFYYRGTAGKYIEFDGNIACLFSGGGASISMMDALEAVGGRAANYTEYSGNPPREKVYELAKIVFSKPNVKGIWIVGGVANFTHIGETMAGIADALRDVAPSVPIVVRRAGPFEEEGRSRMEQTAREKNLNLSWYGREVSMTDTAKILMDKISI